jgi:cell division protein FtsZ
MIHFDLPKEKSSIIKVIGVGGGGSNAVNYMFNQTIDGVNFIICNTDSQALVDSDIPNKIQLGPLLTQGLGAGANPDIGRKATEESLEEIKGILEVNTKMAFITAGMGGGTGTGGAPIIAKICKDLGILTVGIVTTPFAYEGKKRQLQAEEGINLLKKHVDTLLVICNDKLRHQFGNLKMREAFAKADNVLATAAKCITDVINSTGQINVDFADVCTVMRNGGVAILGNAAVSGENRAQKAIEEAMSSPLLNDNDIHGAKWILININSAEGEDEFTMDEVEIIQNYILTQAGENTDVILGLGYDNNLGSSIGITLIATGFEHKNPFGKTEVAKTIPKVEEKIVMTLDFPQSTNGVMKEEVVEKVEEPVIIDSLAPTMFEEPIIEETPMPTIVDMDFNGSEIEESDSPVIHWELDMDKEEDIQNVNFNVKKQEIIKEDNEMEFVETNLTPHLSMDYRRETEEDSILPTAAGGYLARPSNIYAEKKAEVKTVIKAAEKPEHLNPVSNVSEEETPEMLLVFKNEIPAADESRAHQAQTPLITSVEDPAMLDEAEDQQRRAAERIQKLRNLSFNINAADPNNEFDTVPAYIRRNMELYNTVSSVENFYSNYEVKTDENNQTQISTINSFLHGKKPD